MTLKGKMYSVANNFNLADAVSRIDVGPNSHTVQLIVRQPNGVLKIRYMGTAVDVTVLTAEADRFLKLMPEKPKVPFLTF